MIFFDFETLKTIWTVSYLDTRTREIKTIVNNRDELLKFYEENKKEIFVGFNNRHFDNYIFQGILAGFDPYKITDWIINKDRKGWEFSSLLRNYPLITYDVMVGFRGLKEIEAFMGISIEESSIPFDIDRELTEDEIKELVRYNQYDVMATFLTFLETDYEYESHIGLIEEFNLPLWMLGRTKSQISAEILNASQPPMERNDEFDIEFVDNLQLGKYEYIREHFQNWADNIQDYDKIALETEVVGVPTVVANGGIHSSFERLMDTGRFILLDVGSFYPALMIEHGFISRNVPNPEKFKQIRDERIEMKKMGDPRESPRKIVLNGSYGSTKFKYSKLYDPLMANNICLNGQLLLIDLAEKLEKYVKVYYMNTDSVMVKVYSDWEEDRVKEIVKEWETRHNLTMDYEYFNKIVVKDVNNYIFIGDEKIDRGGAVVKRLSKIDNDLPIVNKAVVDYFVKGISPREIIYNSDKLIDFQKITKISNKYEFGFHEVTGGKDKYSWQVPIYRTRNKERYLAGYKTIQKEGHKLSEKVIRCFASTDPRDGTIFKKHKEKDSLDKTGATPEKAFIDNGDITEKGIPSKLDLEWYINLAEQRIKEFVR